MRLTNGQLHIVIHLISLKKATAFLQSQTALTATFLKEETFAFFAATLHFVASWWNSIMQSVQIFARSRIFCKLVVAVMGAAARTPSFRLFCTQKTLRLFCTRTLYACRIFVQIVVSLRALFNKSDVWGRGERTFLLNCLLIAHFGSSHHYSAIVMSIYIHLSHPLLESFLAKVTLSAS